MLVDIDRKEELELLRELLENCRSLNRGNRVIEKMRFIIETSEKLTEIDLKTARPSFFDYLVKELNTNKADINLVISGLDPEKLFNSKELMDLINNELVGGEI